MKFRRWLTHLCSFLFGVVLTVFASSQYIEYLTLVRRSSVDQPVSSILADITATAERGELRLAAQKTELLSRYWDDYLHGDRPPEQFVGDIRALDLPAD
jgi:hypothetical protein